MAAGIFDKQAKVAKGMLGLRIKDLQAAHGGLRPLARALGVSPSYLGRLRDGRYDKPSDEILKKLGLERLVLYVVRRKSNRQLYNECKLKEV